VVDIAIGLDRAVWIATSPQFQDGEFIGGGVDRYADGQWRAFTTVDGLGSDVVKPVAVGNDGRVWAGTDTGVSVFEDGVGIPRNSSDEVDAGVLRVIPNSFNSRVTLVFGIPNHTVVSLTVSNAMGQHVKRLLSDQEAGGTHSVVWGGQDESGRQITSEVYFIELRFDSRIYIKRASLVR